RAGREGRRGVLGVVRAINSPSRGVRCGQWTILPPAVVTGRSGGGGSGRTHGDRLAGAAALPVRHHTDAGRGRLGREGDGRLRLVDTAEHLLRVRDQPPGPACRIVTRLRPAAGQLPTVPGAAALVGWGDRALPDHPGVR